MLIYDYKNKSDNIPKHLYGNQDQNFSSIFPLTKKSIQNFFGHHSNDVKLTEIKRMSSSTTYLKTFLSGDYDSSDEDAIGWYMTILKILIRELSPGILCQMYNSKTKKFPMLEPLLRHSHHQDVMIRNAARLSLLTIFKKCQEETDSIVQLVVLEHFKSIVLFLKRTIKSIEHFADSDEKILLQKSYRHYDEEFEYIDDILNLENNKVNSRVRLILLKAIITPLLKSVTEENISGPSQVFYVKSTKIIFTLLGKILVTVTDQILKEIICDFFRPGEFDYKEFMNKDEAVNCRNKVVNTLRYIISNEGHSSMPNALWVLKITAKFYESINQTQNLIYLFKTYAKPILTYLAKDVEQSFNSVSVVMDLMVLFLEPLVMKNTWTSSLTGTELRNRFKQLILDLYLHVCNKVKVVFDLNVFSIIDRVNNNFMNGKYKLESNSLNNLESIDESNAFEGSSVKQQSKLHILLKQMLRLRYLCLCASQKKEKILPLMPNKAKIGEILHLGNSLHCKKLIHNQTYASNHYLKLTNSHILILQKMEIKSKGIVIFSEYYRDLKWVKRKNSASIIFATSETLKGNVKSKPLCIQIKFRNYLSTDTVIKTLIKARQKQSEILQKKCEDLLELKFSQ